MANTDKFWMIGESNSDEGTCYYKGYYENGKPVFCIAIAEGLEIASLFSAKELHNKLNKLFPCEIWEVSNNTVTKIL